MTEKGCANTVTLLKVKHAIIHAHIAGVSARIASSDTVYIGCVSADNYVFE